MNERDTLNDTESFPLLQTRSIFPAFAVNVPMPSDTAIPGSYRRVQITESFLEPQPDRDG